MKTLPNLTGLRFILALLVVIFHIPEFSENRGFPFYNDLSIFNRGEEAVYLFFSLSGFLIIRLLYLEKIKTNTVDLKSFFKRRMLRIFPLYYLVLTFGFIYYRIILNFFNIEFENNNNLYEVLFFSYTFFPNIATEYGPGGIIEVLWSIGIEEQFYLLIAPILFLLPIKRILSFLLIFTVLYFSLFFSETFEFLIKYKMYFFYFSFSGFCSIIMLKNKVSLEKFRYIIFIFFILYLTTSIFKINLNDAFYHLVSMLLFGLFISVLSEKPVFLLENKISIQLGKISYGIYMYHAIMMQFAGYIYLKWKIYENIAPVYSILIFYFFVLFFTIIISQLSYKYYESYFLKFKMRSI